MTPKRKEPVKGSIIYQANLSLDVLDTTETNIADHLMLEDTKALSMDLEIVTVLTEDIDNTVKFLKNECPEVLFIMKTCALTDDEYDNLRPSYNEISFPAYEVIEHFQNEEQQRKVA